MELNTITLSDFTKLATVIWLKAQQSVPKVARMSGLFKIVPIPSNSGETRNFDDIDLNEYASFKGQSDQASRAGVTQGLEYVVDLIKSFLIYGESPAVGNA